MKSFRGSRKVLFGVSFFALFSAFSPAQTLTLNDGAIVQSRTNRVGVNIGAIDYWDQGQILKNLIGSSNPGMEPLTQQQIWAIPETGTTTSFTVPDIYDGVPPNYWAGGTFNVVESQSGGAELGCTGTIASNTGPNYPLAGRTTYSAPVITISTPCAGPFSVGDIVILTLYVFPTPESWWENGADGGTQGGVSGGAKLLSDTTDLCATCGKQALNMNATVAGSSATAAWYYDGEGVDDIFVLMNGTYQVSFWAKAASGSPVLTVSARRGSTGGFNCGTYTPSLSSTWALYTWNCTASETQATTTPGNAGVSFTTTGGSVYLDNVSFAKINANPSNTTVLRDEVIDTLQTYYGTSIGKNPGTLRYWVNQNAETVSNWTEPDYAHGPTGWGTGYFVSPGGNGQVSLSLEDYLIICQYLNAEPYLEVPVTLSTADAGNLIEFLGSPSSTTYGARRAALGQTEPWTTVFSKIHLSFCNECWNGQSFVGQSLSDRASQPNNEYYYDYSVRTRDIFAAMRGDPYYSAPSFDLVMNAQTATNYTMDIAIQRAKPDSIEIEDYTYGTVSSYTPDSALWQPAMVDPWEKVSNPSDIRNFYQSVHDYQSQKTCGASGTATCNVNIYEWGQGTLGGSIDQTHLDYINAGAGEGVVMALQPLLNMQYYDIVAQSFFGLTEYKNGGLNGLTAKLWGNTIDMGGATNNVRPTFLGVQLINQSIIGPMYSCPINSNLTYDFAGSPNGNSPMPAMTNVPYLYAFCFENGTKRSLVLINTDLSSSHTLTFGGINPPSGTVTQRQYAPTALDAMNEAPTGTATNKTPATVAIETSTLSSPSSINLPPFSATALDYTSPGPQAAAMPSFSPAAGTYTTTQQVTISDTTPGTTIYYTTNGTMPTKSSSVYSSAIMVSANETLEAIAVETGYTNSPATTAAYTIAPILPTPTFSPAAGTYATTQSVTISESASGATVYYTTNGTTPTTSSSVYTGGTISVSATGTLEAIAVETGYTDSVAGTALYTISPLLAAPIFSPAPGTFLAPQSVTMSDSVSGANIYYTTDGTTPTSASTKQVGAIWVSANETFQAIAIKNGYTNSAVITGAYTIAPVLATPTFSPNPGIYSGPQTVTISDRNSGSTFYYTTNGTTPTILSTKYTGPVTVISNETLEVIAVQTNYTTSAVGTATYSISGSSASLASPTPGLSTVLGTTNVGFRWNPGTAATLYQFCLSSVKAGACDLFTYKGSALSATVPSLPANGATVYVTLWWRVNGIWQQNNYLYTESGTPVPAVLQSPTPGLSTVLGTTNVGFQWNAGRGVTLYQFCLSSVRAGACDLFTYKGSALSATVPSLPANGATVYATLWSCINGTWQQNNYLYTEQ